MAFPLIKIENRFDNLLELRDSVSKVIEYEEYDLDDRR